MTLNTVKLIAIDMDGTLLNAAHEITPFTAQTLKKAVEAGIYIVLATGRGMTSIRPYEQQLQLQQPIIAANGADIYYEANIEGIKNYIAFDDVQRIFEVINRINIPFWGFTDQGEFADRELSEEEQMKCLKIGVQSENEQLLKSFYEEAQFFENIELTTSGITNYEMNKKGVSKAFGLSELCKQLQIPLENTMCFGDSGNDIQMFKVAGFPVAMGNAIEELKEIAQTTAFHHDEEGVAKAIQHLVLNKI